MWKKKTLLIGVFVGILAKFYGINQHWTASGHYNYGGSHITAYTTCMAKTPLVKSHGIVHFPCDNEDSLGFYTSVPPALIWVTWGLTSFLGNHEWVYRSFVAVFSILLLLVLFKIARIIWPSGDGPYWVIFIQSLSLGSVYLGTHIDFTSEFTTFLILVSVLLALQNKMFLACVMTVLGGFFSPFAYFNICGLFVYSVIRKKNILLVTLFGFISFAVAVAVIAYSNQTWDIIEFVRMKMFDPGYVKEARRDWKLPLVYILTWFQSFSEIMGPLFATLAFFELLKGESSQLLKIKQNWKEKFRNLKSYHLSLIVLSGAGLMTALVAWQYVIVHFYLFMMLLPLASVLAAQAVMSIKNQGFEYFRKSVPALSFLGLAFVLTYPYGANKTNAVHDVINSLLVSFTCLWVLILIWRKKEKLFVRTIFPVFALLALGNISQTIKYRNEPDSEYEFCRWAREEYQKTGKAIIAERPSTPATRFVYCHGIPIQFKD